MNFEAWMEEVENILWVRLNASPDDYDSDFEAMYERGLDPEEVAYELYEEEDEELDG